MSLLRTRGRVAGLVLSLASFAVISVAHAQSPSYPAAPAPTPAPASSLPSVPAATPVNQQPAAATPTPSQTRPPAQPAYQDPLEQPLPASVYQAPSPQAAPIPEPATSVPSVPAYDPSLYEPARTYAVGSTYIPVDSPVYPMALRLYSLGYLDSAFIGLRPWTRQSLLHMLEKSSDNIVSDGNQQAMEILAWLNDYLAAEAPAKGFTRGRVYGVETLYTRLMGIDGQSLRDSYHLGQTIANDYGRPYEPGFNAIGGFSSVNEMGRFSLYVRGEYQHAPAGAGYSLTLANQLSCNDFICPFAPPNDPQATIPYGKYVAAQNPFRLQEATLSFHWLGHEISGGKSDAWLGPGMGGAMLWSNNAEDLYSFRIDRIEPMHIPYFSAIFGPIRYDFFVGSLKGHTAPNSPWMHSEAISLRPTKNFEFAFERSVIWGGEGHEPVTLHTFLRSFFSFSDTENDPTLKNSSLDPGDRLSDFTFSWRLPFVSRYLTLYLDSICHDDVSPVSAPRRAAYRPGIYLSQFPGLPKLDLRVEGASTDTSTLRSFNGEFIYYETVQRQGYTNKGFLMGDQIGREAKGGQAWLTYHLAPEQSVQLSYFTKETAKDFIAGGVTQTQIKAEVVKRLHRDIELNAWAQYERWKAPVYASPEPNPNPLDITGPALYFPNAQHDTTIAAQITWYPKLHIVRGLNGK